MKSWPLFSSRILIVLFFLIFAQVFVSAEIKVALQETRTWNFNGITFTNDFPGARINALERTAPGEFRILIQPENAPINNSAWYAFEVSARRPQTIRIVLDYEEGRHRYQPKISNDLLNWEPLDQSKWEYDREKNRAILTLDIGRKPIRIAGQEMIGTEEVWGWMNEVAQKSFVRKTTIGKSLLGQPIEAMSIGSPDATNYVFILGRQHPPEISATVALINFVDNLTKNSALTRRFRENFQVIVIPMINPDGVNNGHWRHNMAGVDLNRDWMTFAQPETRAVRDLLLQLAEREEARPFLLLDFHSTFNDIFYTQEDEHPTFPENFTAKWLAAIQEQFPDYNLRRRGSHTSNHVTSKAWGYATFGIPSITYEIGDHTDRDLIREMTEFTSEEMMRILLAELENLSEVELADDKVEAR